MTATELMLRLRDRDDWDNVLEDVVILEGAGGPPEGGACPAYILVGGTLPAGVLDKIRPLANEWAGREVIVHRVRRLQ